MMKTAADTGEEEIPAAPKPAGLKHLVRIDAVTTAWEESVEKKVWTIEL